MAKPVKLSTGETVTPDPEPAPKKKKTVDKLFDVLGDNTLFVDERKEPYMAH